MTRPGSDFGDSVLARKEEAEVYSVDAAPDAFRVEKRRG
jgi:hypothetical protein